VTALRFRLMVQTLSLLLALSVSAAAQPVQPPTPAEAAAALNPTPTPTQFSRQQLDQMLAPIALYPDQLLMQVLMAATFPQQLIDAGHWLQDPNNAALKGDALVSALQPLPWDPSVKSLVAFPQIVAMMNEHFDWTQALGVAFANQQTETMARIQFLRGRALAAGHIRSTPQIRFVREGPEVAIEPADPSTLYVPVYNPAEVYGQWPDQDYRPVYVPPPPQFVNPGFVLGAGLGFSLGFGIVHSLWGWGHPDWQNNQVVINRTQYTRITNITNITNNNTTINNNTWRRTAPVTPVVNPPPVSRPAMPAPQPPGTVTPAAIKPLPHPAPTVTHPLPAPAPGPAPAATPTHPVSPPTPVHPAPTVTHPLPAPAPGPAPAATPSHPAPPPTVTHPAPAPHPAPTVTHPAPPPHPAPVVHPPPAAAHPPPPAPHPAPAAHPAAKPGKPGEKEQH